MYINITCVKENPILIFTLSRKFNFKRSQDGNQGFMMLYKFWKLQSQYSIMEWKNKAVLKGTTMP